MCFQKANFSSEFTFKLQKMNSYSDFWIRV
jgi:hypothetical protein